MAAFIPKKLPLDETAGEKLRQARSLQKLSLEETAKRLNIRPDYLAALEDERWDRLPAGLYGRNFLKQYARFLRLDWRRLTENLETTNSPITDPFSQKIVQPHKFIVFPRLVRNALIIAAVIACLLYLIAYAKNLFLPPVLEISYPAQNLLTASSTLTVAGRTEAEAEVRINGELVLNNHGGRFAQEVSLKKGLNNLVISAKKKYSQSRNITRQILVE